jgi:homoserine kinase type II
LAVYATFDEPDFIHITQAFGLGAFRSATGIPQGSINTNYRLECAAGRFFLRHTTVRSEADLRFEADLLTHLAESAFPAPQLLRVGSGAPYLALRGGWVSVFRYLSGEELTRAQLTHEHAERLGTELGKLHRVTNSFGGDRANPYGPGRVRQWLAELAGHADAEIAQIARELQGYLDAAQLASGELVPRGVIHADLFMDNVKWLADRVSAFFDFEMACRDAYTLDLAITLNAWCFEGEYRKDLCQALVRGYQQERKLLPREHEDLYHQALFGAVRYAASRIRDFHLSPLPPDRLFKKDFRTYLARARALSAMRYRSFQALVGL